MQHHISRTMLAAACAGTALLYGFSLAGTAAAADQATLTLNAAQGSTLAGHTFGVYRIGGYHDAVSSGEAIASFGVRGTTASNAWAQDAIDNYNQAEAEDIDIPLGYDAAGAVASLADTGSAMQIRGIAKALAESSRRPAAAKTVTGSGIQAVVTVEEGYYLVVDSQGAPMLIGTKIDGRSLNGTELGVATVKSKSITVDKRIGADT